MKEVLAQAPDRSKALDDQMRELGQKINELRQDIETMRAREEARLNPPGGPNDHPLWP